MPQPRSWDDARILLAVVRHGSEAGAAQALGLDAAAVARAVARLEDAAGTALFARDGGRMTPTDAVARMAVEAEDAEAALKRMFRAESEGEATGAVRIAAAPLFTSHLLAPALPLLRQLAPGVIAELIATSETAGLTRRDADIALRLSRPGEGAFLARRIATIDYGVYARRGVAPEMLPWIGYDELLAELPEARWMARREGEPLIARAADMQTLYQAVKAGIARALLPAAIAKRDSTLITLTPPEPTPSRDLWLLVGRQVRQERRVSLALGWVEAVARDAFMPVRE